jgi:hypothetical protein
MVRRRRLQQQPDERRERLARIDAKLRTLQETRQATTNERVREILDARLSDLAARRDAFDEVAS